MKCRAAYHSLRTPVLANVQLDCVLPSTWEAESLNRLSAAKRSVLEVSAGIQPYFQPRSVPLADTDPIMRSIQFSIINRVIAILQVTPTVNAKWRDGITDGWESNSPISVWLVTFR